MYRKHFECTIIHLRHLETNPIRIRRNRPVWDLSQSLCLGFVTITLCRIRHNNPVWDSSQSSCAWFVTIAMSGIRHNHYVWDSSQSLCLGFVTITLSGIRHNRSVWGLSHQELGPVALAVCVALKAHIALNGPWGRFDTLIIWHPMNLRSRLVMPLEVCHLLFQFRTPRHMHVSQDWAYLGAQGPLGVNTYPKDRWLCGDSLRPGSLGMSSEGCLGLVCKQNQLKTCFRVDFLEPLLARFPMWPSLGIKTLSLAAHSGAASTLGAGSARCWAYPLLHWSNQSKQALR